MTFRLRHSTTFLTAAVALIVPMVVVASADVAVAQSTTTQTFNYSGSNANFTVPAGITSIHVVASGGAGGEILGFNAGKGGRVTFDLAVTGGTVIRVQVGGQGSNSGNSPRAGAWPDGGDSVNGNGETGSGGGSTRVYKMNGSTPVLLAVAGGGGGSTDMSTGGDGGLLVDSAAGSADSQGMAGDSMGNLFHSDARGGSLTAGGAGGCQEDIVDPNTTFCGASGASLSGGDADGAGGGGGGGGYFGGGAGRGSGAGGGGSSWWDSSLVTGSSQSAGQSTAAGSVVISYLVHEAIDDTYSLSWNTNGKIGLNVTSISSGPNVVGTYSLYDSATVTGSPIASVTVNGNGDNALGTTSRTLLTSTRFAVKFTHGNANYPDQYWENQQVKCGPGSYNATDGFIPCTVASVGHYVASSGSTSESPAAAGSYVSQTGQSAGLLCGLGTYQPNTGQTSCLPAAIGYYVNITGATAQSQCAVGTTTITTGQSVCISSSTTAPTLSSPLGASSWKMGSTNPTITYTLGETPSPGTVKVRWILSTDSTTYRELTMDNTTSQVSLSNINALAANSTMVNAHIVSSITRINNIVDASSTMPPGLYTFTISYQNVNQMPVASASASNVALRTACMAGTYSSDGYSSCTPASVGHYVSTSAATAELIAPAGSFVSQQGQWQPTLCAPGTYQPNAGQPSCIPASSGYYVGAPGATSQTACAAGTDTGGNIGANVCVSSVTTTSSTTSTTLPAVTTTVPSSTGATAAKCSVKKGKAITRSCLATNAGITIASSSKVVIKVVASSAKVCKVSGSTVKTLKAGTCSTTVSVTPKSAKKATTYKVKVSVT